MSVFRFRNDSPVIPRPLHNSATRRLTTLPIELINDQRDMSEAGYKNAKIPSLERKQRKKHTSSLKLCHIKLDYTSRLMSVNACAGHANLLCIVPKTLTETKQSKKETTKIQRCSEPRVQQISTAVDLTATRPRTRQFPQDPGEQHTVTRKTCVLVKTANLV